MAVKLPPKKAISACRAPSPKFNHLGEAQSIRGLAQYTEEVRDRFINLAISYNINIITGSMPYVKEDGGLYNVGFLVRRDGSYEMYEKV